MSTPEKATVRKTVYDPLMELMAYYSTQKGEKKEKSAPAGTVEERLKHRIIDGDKIGLQQDLDEARARYAPLDIINTILLDGMKVVGELFGSGQMQLPFVLQSAEVMKAAVAYLEPFMDKADAAAKGSMVLATVKGDVHDIGKNLVDIILTNNGYKVYNLGIKCPIETMLRAVEEHHADAIGMSGLLVKSTLIMKENLEVMNERNLAIPVVLGGAALTRRYVEEDLRPVYRGTLSYANDAFDGLHFMEQIVTEKESASSAGVAVTKKKLLADMQAVHRSTMSFLARIPDGQFAEPATIGTWSIHDVVAHLGAWEGIAADRLELYLEGKRTEIRRYEGRAADEVNVRLVDERRNKTRSELMQEWKTNRARMQECIARLTDADLAQEAGGASVADLIIENTTNHQRHHLKAIREWLSAHPAVSDEEELSGFEAKLALAAKQEGSAGSSVATAKVIPVPPFYGARVIDDIPLEEIYRYINETALFRGQWQVRKGKLTEEAYRTLIQEKVYPDFQRVKREAREEKFLQPRVVYGYFPCHSSGDDLIIYKPADLEDGSKEWSLAPQILRAPESGAPTLAEWMRFTFPRQKKGKKLCIADFFLSRQSGAYDVVAFHLVTMGASASDRARELFESNNYKEYLYFHGLSVETAEALAELWHSRIRHELGFGACDARREGTDEIDIKRLFSQGYQGSRYSFGYPACPSLEDHVKLFTLLRPERIGVELTEEFQLVPEQSTDAIIIHHPEARYFTL